ncbi:unnamed protein product [Phytomonas sp. Hart1]|nr:unnamed protein product [Phytomonas sp. Hart1]|eukprot:CCW68879.1 unnamed protein product [Phytomonas sp. isolate Hart1]
MTKPNNKTKHTNEPHLEPTSEVSNPAALRAASQVNIVIHAAKRPHSPGPHPIPPRKRLRDPFQSDEAANADAERSLDSDVIPTDKTADSPLAMSDGSTSRARPLNDPDFYVPWDLRQAKHAKRFVFFDFLRIPRFWEQLEFALRVTLLAAVIPALFMTIPGLPNPFVSYVFVFSSMALASRVYVGESLSYVFSWLRAGALWVPLTMLAAALHLGHNVAWWGVYYALLLFVIALFTEDISRRICLYLFNVCMITLLMRKTHDLIYPCRVMADWCIGIVLCTISTFIPYPRFCYKHAENLIWQIAKTTGNTLQGITHSFWSKSNVTRNMAISRVRVLEESLNAKLVELESYQSLTMYEFFAESSEARQIRALKIALFERLRVNISTLLRVLTMVETNPAVVDDSARSQAFKAIIVPHLAAVSSAFDQLMTGIALARSTSAIRKLKPSFDLVYKCTSRLQEDFTMARRMFLYESTYDTMETFFPLMAVYLFTLVSFSEAVGVFQSDMDELHTCLGELFMTLFRTTTYKPFCKNLIFIKTLFLTGNRREVQRVIEAAKVSGAMVLTLGLTYFMDIHQSHFTGPNIIAFVSGMNPVESLQASIVRLTGCLIGSVLGFLAGAYSDTEAERVSLLCLLIFFFTFFRNDKDYGIMSVYAMFVIIPLNAINRPTVKETMDRMNQNTIGIFIYLLISILILPLSPSVILRAKRVNILKRINEALSSILDLFYDPFIGVLADSNSNTQPTHKIVNIDDHNDAKAHNSMNSPSPYYSLRTMRIPDDHLSKITTILNDIHHRIKASKPYVNFSKEERGLVEVDYPVRACAETYEHMRIMLLLLRAMWMSWRLFRRQRLYTKEMRRLMVHLQPVVARISNSFSSIMNLIIYSIQNPTTNLEGEIMKSVLNLLKSCKELQARMNEMLVLLIAESVERFRDPATEGEPPKRLFKNGASSTHPDTTFGSTTANISKGAGDFAHTAVALQFPKAEIDRKHALSRHRLHHLSLPFSKFYSNGSDTNQTNARSSRYDMADESSIEVIRKGTLNKKQREGHHVLVPLLENFEFPISSEDSESLHSFALSLLMFANETKMLMTSIQVMTDHACSKK